MVNLPFENPHQGSDPDPDEKIHRWVRRRAKLLLKVIELDDGSAGAATLMLQEVLRTGRAVNELIAARVQR